MQIACLLWCLKPSPWLHNVLSLCVYEIIMQWREMLGYRGIPIYLVQFWRMLPWRLPLLFVYHWYSIYSYLSSALVSAVMLCRLAYMNSFLPLARARLVENNHHGRLLWNFKSREEKEYNHGNITIAHIAMKGVQYDTLIRKFRSECDRTLSAIA